MKKILVIDDDPLIRESIQDLLESQGFQAITASNGSNGLQLAIAKQPDLILCDIQMPEMDGYGVLRALRNHAALKTTPFIFLTARSDYGDLRQGMNLGADDYLSKPCSTDELLVTLNRRLEKQAMLQSHSQQQLDNLRSNIATALPHEFRTPLTGIFTSVELLRLVAEETENAAEVLEIASTIQTSAQRLHRLIQNFLLYTKLEVAARDPQYTSSLSREITWDPMSIITTLATEMAEREKRSADLGLNLQNAAIAMPYFDLEKVLMELLDNAFKFSWPHTPVTIVSQVKADDYEIHITNHGRGMSVEEIATLGGYMQFNRQTYEQQGVGLGLAIAQRLLELHHGQLTITSIPDQITTISIQLPLATQPVEELELEDGA